MDLLDLRAVVDPDALAQFVEDLDDRATARSGDQSVGNVIGFAAPPRWEADQKPRGILALLVLESDP